VFFGGWKIKKEHMSTRTLGLTCSLSVSASAGRNHGHDHDALCVDNPDTDHDPSGARARSDPGCLPSNPGNIHRSHSPVRSIGLPSKASASSKLCAISSAFLPDNNSRRPTHNPVRVFDEEHEPHAALVVDRSGLQSKIALQRLLQQSGV